MTPYTKQIVELHKIHKAIENCGCNKDNEQGGGDENSGNLLMSLIPSNYPKPDLFLFELPKQSPIDVTNYKIDDLINLAIEQGFPTDQGSALKIKCVYESSNLDGPMVSNIILTNDINLYISVIEDNIVHDEIVYNNKTYYYYYVMSI